MQALNCSKKPILVPAIHQLHISPQSQIMDIDTSTCSDSSFEHEIEYESSDVSDIDSLEDNI